LASCKRSGGADGSLDVADAAGSEVFNCADLQTGALAGLANSFAVDFGVPGSPKSSARIAGAKSTVVVPSASKRTSARTRDQVISLCATFGRNFH